MQTDRLPRWLRVVVVLCLGLLVLGAGLFGYRYFTEPTTLTVAAGSPDGEAGRLLSAIASKLVSNNAPVRLKVLDTTTTMEAAQAFASGKADLAIVRADMGDLRSARTVVVMTNAVVMLLAMPGTGIDSMEELKGKTVGVVAGDANHRLVELLTKEYDLAQLNVTFKDVSVADAPKAVQSKQFQALLVVAPITERYLGMIRALFSPDTKKRPTLIPIESAGAIAAVAKAYESYDLPKGTVRGSPAIPDDDLTTLRIPLYLVAKPALDERVVGKLTRAIMDVRRDLVSEYPLLAQIAAPSTDKDAQIQIHPGAAAYFGGEEKSIFDTYGDWYFYGTILLGTVTSGLAAVWKFLIADPNRTKSSPVERLHALTARIRDAKSEPELEEIEEEISRILQEELTRLSDDESQAQALNVTVTRLEHLIAQRSRRFGVGGSPGPAPQQTTAPAQSG